MTTWRFTLPPCTLDARPLHPPCKADAGELQNPVCIPHFDHSPAESVFRISKLINCRIPPICPECAPKPLKTGYFGKNRQPTGKIISSAGSRHNCHR
jgi:hypothetical protein